MHTYKDPEVLGLLYPALTHRDPLDSGSRKVYSDQGSELKDKEKRQKSCTNLGPSSGTQQVGLLVSWQGPHGQAAQPLPTPALAPRPAHTLSRGLGNTGSEIPTTARSLSSPTHLLSYRHLHNKTLRRGRPKEPKVQPQTPLSLPSSLPLWVFLPLGEEGESSSWKLTVAEDPVVLIAFYPLGLSST